MAESRVRRSEDLLDSLTRELECQVWMEVKELRVLSCQHLCCRECLGNIFDRSETSETSAKCPTCQCELIQEPDEYRVCVWANHFRNKLALLKVQLQKDKCEFSDCHGDIVRLCDSCNMFLCYREIIISLSSERLQEECSMLPDDEIVQLAGLSLQTMTNHYLQIDNISKSILEERSFASFMTTLIAGCTERQLIGIVQELNLYDENHTRRLGEHEVIPMGTECLDVQISPTGDLLVGSYKGLLVLNIKTMEMQHHLLRGQHVSAMGSSVGRVYAGITCSSIKSEVVVFDEQYNETNRWSTNKSLEDMTLVNDKLYMTFAMYDNIAVFNAETGANLPDIIRNSTADGIAWFKPNSVIVTDNRYNTVQKYRIANGWSIQWSSSVVRPFGLCVDDKGAIWVRSNENDCITLLSLKGEKIQEIMDERISRLRSICGMCVRNNTLWLCHDEGIAKFQVFTE